MEPKATRHYGYDAINNKSDDVEVYVHTSDKMSKLRDFPGSESDPLMHVTTRR